MTTNKKVVEIVLKSTKSAESWNKPNSTGWTASPTFDIGTASAVILLPPVKKGKKHQTVVQFKESSKAKGIYARSTDSLIRQAKSFAESDDEGVKKRYTAFVRSIEENRAVYDALCDASATLSPEKIEPTSTGIKLV